MNEEVLEFAYKSPHKTKLISGRVKFCCPICGDSLIDTSAGTYKCGYSGRGKVVLTPCKGVPITYYDGS